MTEFDAVGLSFLLDDGEPQVYMAVMMEEQRFWGTVHLIEERNRILLERVHPAMAAAGLPVESVVDENHLISIIGLDAAHQLKTWTPLIVEQVALNRSSHAAAFDKLRATMKKQFPKAKFLTADFKGKESEDEA